MKHFNLKILIAVFLCLFVYIKTYAAIVNQSTVYVGILLNVDNVIVSCDQDYSIEDGTQKFYLSAGNIDMGLLNKEIIMGKHQLKLPVTITSTANISVNDKPYRGGIILMLSKKNKLNIINKVSVEDYLKGILAKEASASWPEEALKTQAVISRTYVLKNLGKHSSEGFDMCDSVHCQVYGGVSAENAKCSKAVDDTKGEVVIFNNDLAQTVFHASCGGWTEDPQYVWLWKNATPPYLKGKRDKYCSDSPHQNWSSKIKEKIIRDKLIKSGYNIGNIKNIKTAGKTPGHAVKDIVISHSKGSLTINAYKFRLAVDPWLIKSTMIDKLQKQGDSFFFKGKGWGHKVGLCQWGAKKMAENRFNYQQILKFYYPGIKIAKIKYGKSR